MGQETEVSAETAVGKFKLSGANLNHIATFATFVLVCLLAYAMHIHREETKEASTLLANAINKMTEAQRDQIAVQREWMCLANLPPEERRQQFQSPSSFCKQIARDR